jgi:prepilin signal peptidase PulO-like enzyme (type II secretory pathway)
MGMVVTLFLGIAAMVVGYAAFGQGGPVAGLVFFGILLVGAIIRVLQPTKS